MAGTDTAPTPDVRIVTSGGRCIPAHSIVLASASPVLENKLDRQSTKQRSLERVVQILGVPCDAVVAFVGLLYSCESAVLRLEDGEVEVMEKYGVHLLVLSHAYRVGWLKRACERGLASRLSAERVIDVLQLARQCDASRLYQKCMLLIAKEFESVQQSEAWRFLQSHDLRLELEILKFIQEADQRKKRRRRKRTEHKMYEQLHEAMECLQHICTEGCTNVGPNDGEPPSKSKGPCTRFRTCEGLQLLIRHFPACRAKLSSRAGCPHCKRMWQLFRLHSTICDQTTCRVPLCKEFKSNIKMERKGDDETWRLLARKVIIAKVMSTLAIRRRVEQQNRRSSRHKRTRQIC